MAYDIERGMAVPDVGPITKRQPVVTEAIASLEKHVEDLAAMIAELEQRLAPVLMPSAPPVESCKAQAEQDPAVPMAQVLARLSSRVASARQQVAALVQRLEI